ncbi:succinyl-CoA:mesaconate CoA transferase [Halogranum gelatinilyticum]|uniref:Succinyl-CoA:mesaconate CoA transferase n=1 Tax=Halogranum gelatinilyticum TaxID=660521 RepID=A0A1G9T5P4_9EURY|nr:succinyl-CoA:mesaconate CoA-transferase [Halogranum gelatinilyticum]SDM43039.1 succinyl-CoA:mesaconate CoA transferase [Halogranum gelatinilyticum]
MAALSDLRVLDLTQVLAGPYCTMLLADLGADVVKVERPGGDLIRSNPPFVRPSEEPESDGSSPSEQPYGGYFQSVNRGKRSIELDLGSDEGRADFLSLVEAADVVVENYRAGTMERFDLGYETLREHNPQLVYSAIRGFGDPRTGETHRQGQPSFDLVAQALGGVMEITGEEDGPPTKVGPGIGDLFTATLNAVGILAAVHHRDRTGEGQFVDTGMYDSIVSLCERTVYQYSYTGDPPTRQGNSHPTLFPYDSFETADGHVVIAAFGDNHWEALCRAMDRPDLAADYPDAASRRRNREPLGDEIADWTASRTSDEVVDALVGEVPCERVQSVEDVFADSHIRDREMLVEVDQPGTDERVTIAGQPIKMTATPSQPGRRAPLLDEHHESVFSDWVAQPSGRRTDTARDATDAADD